MAIQVDFSSPLPGTMVPIAIAGGSNLPTGAPIVRDAPRCRQAEPEGRQLANHARNTTKKNAPNTTKMFLAAGGLALSLAGLGLFASAGTAVADGVDATPMPPAVIDEDGFQNYDTSSYPAPRLGRRPRLRGLGREFRRIRAARGEGRHVAESRPSPCVPAEVPLHQSNSQLVVCPVFS